MIINQRGNQNLVKYKVIFTIQKKPNGESLKYPKVPINL